MKVISLLKRPLFQLNWAAYIITVMLLVGIMISSLWFHRVADNNRRVKSELNVLKYNAYRLSVIEWKVMYYRKVDPRSLNEIKTASGAVNNTLQKVLRLKQGGTDLNSITGDYRKYMDYLNLEFDLIRQNRLNQAELFDKNYVDPTFNNLIQALNSASSDHALMAEKAFSLGNTSLEVTLASTIMVILTLFWRLHRQRMINKQIETDKILEQKINRLERLNLIGEMAASIGHEVRNPMTSVRGFLQLLHEKESDTTKREHYEVMIQELDRANSIISEYLSLAKNKRICLKKQNLNDVIQKLLPLLEAKAMMKDTNIKVDYGSIPELLIDDEEIRQMIINLVNNAIEASPAASTVTIGTSRMDNKVILQVQDQGTGLAPEVVERLGTPFVTTKDDGTGLGLAVSCNIANRHSAELNFETYPTGTTFYVQFGMEPLSA